MTPAEAARRLREARRRLETNVRQAEAESVEDLRETAEGLSGGTVSQAQLRKDDHPFARRHGRAKQPPEVVNIQEGDFVTSWAEEGPEETGGPDGALVSRIFNTAGHARFLFDEGSDHEDGGTDRMFGRPVHLAAAEEVEPRREQRLEAVIEDALG